MVEAAKSTGHVAVHIYDDDRPPARHAGGLPGAPNAAGARYLVIGGIACILHGYVRATTDLDVLIERSPDNAARVLDGLVNTGYGFAREWTARELLARPITVIGDDPAVDVFTVPWTVKYEEARRLWYTMPYVEGESLRDRLRRETQLSAAEAVRLTGEVADALEYAHGGGIVHRDIKPENILLSQGHARVADFGVARAADTEGVYGVASGLRLPSPDGLRPSGSSVRALRVRLNRGSASCTVCRGAAATWARRAIGPTLPLERQVSSGRATIRGTSAPPRKTQFLSQD